MQDWDNFKTFKERGEWVELLFMAAAASHGYHVLKPWGDSFEYDVGVESRAGMLRVQVKSSTARNGTGYLCQFRRNYLVEEPYSIDELDIFAMYVIPEAVWYLIPASVILTPPRKVAVTLCPVTAKKRPLPLRAIPRSLASAVENAKRVGQVQTMEAEQNRQKANPSRKTEPHSKPASS